MASGAQRKSNSPDWLHLFVGLIVALLSVSSLAVYEYIAVSLHPTPPIPRPDVDVPFVTTPSDVVAKMLEVADLQEGDVVYDLGCGDGRIVIAAAKKYGCRAVGIEKDPKCVRLSRKNVRMNQLDELVTIERADIFDVDLSQADVVTLYLLPELNVKLLPQLQKLKPGARIVSHRFDMMDVVKPDQVITMKSNESDWTHHTVYLWKTPLKIEPAAEDSARPDR